MSSIVTNNSANLVYTQYQKNQDALSQSMEKLATGSRINRGADDPAGLAISETLKAQVGSTNTAINTIANASNFINSADGYLQSVNDILGRMSELSIEMGDATMSSGDKSNITTEFNALQGEISSMQTQAKFNNSPIFASTVRQFTVDANGSTFSFNSAGLASLSTIAASITSMSATDTGILQVTELSSAISAIAAQRAILGANQSQLNFKSTSLQNYANNVSAAESRIRDTDVAQESASLARSQVLVQVSTAMLAQANAQPQTVLKLLGA